LWSRTKVLDLSTMETGNDDLCPPPNLGKISVGRYTQGRSREGRGGPLRPSVVGKGGEVLQGRLCSILKAGVRKKMGMENSCTKIRSQKYCLFFTTACVVRETL